MRPAQPRSTLSTLAWLVRLASHQRQKILDPLERLTCVPKIFSAATTNLATAGIIAQTLFYDVKADGSHRWFDWWRQGDPHKPISTGGYRWIVETSQ